MPCYHPLHAYRGKSKDVQKTLIAFKRSDSWRGERIELPCGQCIGCRLERARMWAVRCVHEASLYEKNCFITLTYDKKYLPENGSLCLEHFQKFMKRLRKRYGSGIRYFHCGEYGDENRRPHYHALLFNHDFMDKTFFSERNGYKAYTSQELSELWQKGFTVVADVSFESAGYVARYSMKKITGEKAKVHYGDLHAEYATMSRRPGIGKNWYLKYAGDVYPNDRVIINGTHTRPPRYYDDLLGKADPSTLALIKIEREKDAQKYVQTDTINGKPIFESDSSDSRLIEKEKTKLGQISLLNRHKDGV